MLNWFGSEAGKFLMAIVAGVAFVFGVAVRERHIGQAEGRKELEDEQRKEQEKREKQAEDAVDAGRASGDTPDDRVRKNDDAWD